MDAIHVGVSPTMVVAWDGSAAVVTKIGPVLGVHFVSPAVLSVPKPHRCRQPPRACFRRAGTDCRVPCRKTAMIFATPNESICANDPQV